VVKRAFDLVFATLALVVTAPLLAVAALAIKLGSPGPVLYSARRAGLHGRPFGVLKLRTMRVGSDASAQFVTAEDDERVTPVGRVLRRFKLDELPQFWHVLRGDMSLVGPRPETVDFVGHHREAYHEILGVRPGVFGFSQIAFVAEGQILDEDDPLSHYIADILPQKVKLDLMYARHRTLAVDMRIMFWSLVAVLMRRQVAVNRQTGRMNLRHR
jgi:lipopolysaccharide/colanic/teichoic acid biosynthesis glycosyltransferase